MTGMKFFAAIALMLLAAPALAQEQHGCDKFAWPLDAEKAALTSPSKQAVSAGTTFDRTSAVAIEMPLISFAEAKLQKPPERAPKKPDGFAGFVSFAAGMAGKYK